MSLSSRPRIRIMKGLLFPLVLLLAAAGAAAHGATAEKPATVATTIPSSAHVLSRAEFDRLIAKPGDLLLIDVRRPDEISKIGGLPVYLNVQLGDLQRDLAFIPKGRLIVTVSNHAKRAVTAADLLSSKGFKVAGALGVQTYEQEGGTLTRVAIPAISGPAQPAR
jgi:rhodanese-related sulfurtransferase